MNRRNRSLLVVAAVLLSASMATSRPTFPAIWAGIYPGSLTDDNVLNTGSACQLCHRQSFGGDGWNGYGWRIRQEFLSGLTITNFRRGLFGNPGNPPEGTSSPVPMPSLSTEYVPSL